METIVPQNLSPLPSPENSKRPIIGISGGMNGSSASIAAIVTQIRSVGGEPRFIGDHAGRIAKNGSVESAIIEDLKGIDALVVMGNNGDIDPAKYNAAKHPETKVETDTARAAYEEAAIQKAMDAGMPVLAICGGMQRLNVMGGGTLFQHVPDIVGDNHHMQSELPFVPVQVVSIAQDSKLGAIAGPISSIYTPTHQELPPGLVLENSFHHQAVDKVRSDFRISALSDDGVVEAIEPTAGSRYDNQYVVGVQWHPEFGASDLGPKIAASVTGAALAFAKEKEAFKRDNPPAQPPEITWAKRLLVQQQNAVMMR